MEKSALLHTYQITASEPLNRGMEAEVYALDERRVLKLYTNSTSRTDLQTLQHFYTALDGSGLTYALPEILQITPHGDYTIVIEKQLYGQPLSELSATRDPHHMDELLERYLTAVSELAQVPMPPGSDRYKLFDPIRISQRSDGDWHTFLRRYLNQKLAETAPYFARDVADYAAKVQRIQDWLATPYAGPHSLIHGDFFPGNLLVDETGSPTALLDFGLFTMYGDPLFDLATAWVLFDMYDELQANLRARLLEHILARFGNAIRPKLYQYVLLYSFLSANTYAPDCTDGHYAWCVANLNNTAYWASLR